MTRVRIDRLSRRLVLALAGLLAALSLGVAAQSASAYDVSISPAGGYALSTTRLTYSDTGGLISFSCPVTLYGSLAAGPSPLAAGTSLGSVTRAVLGACSTGSAAMATTRAWSVRISSVLGIAPYPLTGLQLDLVGFNFGFTGSFFGIPMNCRYAGTLSFLLGLSGANPYANGSASYLGNVVPFDSGDAVCPSAARFAGSAALSPSQTFTVS